jgi:chaperonin GroEL
MSHKRLRFHAEAREKVLHGAQALADAVRVTLGPKSKSVLIERQYGRPLVCNDGVTIVKELELDDPEENLGVQVLRQAAERTGDLVGDGTTTSTLLACAIYSAGVRNIAAVSIRPWRCESVPVCVYQLVSHDDVAPARGCAARGITLLNNTANQ